MAHFAELFRRYDRLMLFDTETTGLDYCRDEIIEFAAVVLELRIPEYQWEQVKGFTQEELNKYQEIVRRIESKLYENAKSKRKKMIH